MASSTKHELVEIGQFTIKRVTYTVRTFSGFKYPHFSINSTEFYSTLLRIDKPEHWINNWYNNHPNPLNSNLVQHLSAFLNAKSSQNPSVSNWQYLITSWNRLNPDYKVKVSTKIPDYSKVVYDFNKITKWNATIEVSRNKQYEEYEKTLPKWEYVAFNQIGSGDNMETSVNSWARKGYRFCGAVQGNDCTLAVVFMERPRLELSLPNEPDDENFWK